MKLYGFCSLLLCQIGSIFGASPEKSTQGLVTERNGYVEYQSEESKARKDSFILDFSFEPDEYILDWADLGDGMSQTVRAIALVCMQNSESDRGKKAAAQLKPLCNYFAVQLLRVLKNESRVTRYPSHSVNCNDFEEKFDINSLANIQAFALRLQTKHVPGAAKVLFNANAPKKFTCFVGSQDWHASLHLKNCVSDSMGSIDFNIAENQVRSLIELNEDLHMLIFHRKPVLVLQGEE